jgi:catechol 2,3-dioxygenase-like lactoylglutathione lyase family enzyme
MGVQLASVAVVVADYDAAIAFYCGVLGFELVEDVAMPAGKRWVRIARAGGDPGASIVLARAATDHQRSRVGDQTGGRVFLFLHTDDFEREHARLVGRGVRFVEPPRDEPYGRVAVFEDLYGNRIDLIEPRAR